MSQYEEWFTYDLLDAQDRTLGALDGVLGGDLTASTSATVKVSGSLDWVKTRDIDWLTHRVRVFHEMPEPTPWGRRVVRKPLITALVRVPGRDYDDTGETSQLDLYDKLVIPQNDTFGTTYAVPAGVNIIDQVAVVLTSCGIPTLALNLTPSDKTTATARVWDANASKLQVINDLLDSAGYFSLYCDPLGFFRADPYVAPENRSIAYQFIDDAHLPDDFPEAYGAYLPAFSSSFDPFSTPNRYVCVSKTDGTTEALSSIATAADDPRDYWVTRTDTDVDAANQATLDAITAMRLDTVRRPYETLDITTPDLGLQLNDVVQFTSSDHSITRRAVVQKLDYPLQTGGLVRTTIRSLL